MPSDAKATLSSHCVFSVLMVKRFHFFSNMYHTHYPCGEQDKKSGGTAADDVNSSCCFSTNEMMMSLHHFFFNQIDSKNHAHLVHVSFDQNLLFIFLQRGVDRMVSKIGPRSTITNSECMAVCGAVLIRFIVSCP